LDSSKRKISNFLTIIYPLFSHRGMKNVVIIGGGFAGSVCAKKLERGFNVTLVDTKDYFEFTPSILRLAVSPESIRTIRVPHQNYLSHTTVISEKALKIDHSSILTSTGKHPYDYLIIASGAKYGLPIKGDNMVVASHSEELRKAAKQVQEASSILIIGAGLVGVELAGEIIEAYPGKKVIILEALDKIMSRSPEKAQRYVKNFLEKRGVKFILNEKLLKCEGSTYITDKGSKITPDVAFLSIGITPHCDHFQDHCAAHLDPRKFLSVNEHLQVGNFKNVFAAGDVTAIMEEKTAHNAERHADVIVENISRLEKAEQLVKYNSASAPMVISLGKKHGVLVMKNKVVTGKMPGLLKRFVEWKSLRKYR